MKALRKPRRAVSESTLVTAILKALQLKGVFAWRNNSGLTVLPAQAKSGRRVIKGGEAGSPDIFLVVSKRFVPMHEPRPEPIPLALLCGLEIKTATGKLQPSQVAWHAKAERHGVRVAVVRGVSEALRQVEQWKRGAT